MQSDREMPGNPWPHEMVIHIDNSPRNFTALLFIRHAWGIAGDLDIPRATPLPDPGDSLLPETASAELWEERWRSEWELAWEWFSIDPDRRPGTPAYWMTEYGPQGIDGEALRRWEASVQPTHGGVPLEQTPERLSLPALVDAWRTGLDRLVTLPLDGYFARRIGRYLILSDETRDDPASFTRALATAPDLPV
jgi:hypothetical protein